jgi:hypothetical protein
MSQDCLGRAPLGCPGPDGRRVHRYSSGATSRCATHCSGSGCGKHRRAVVAAASLPVRGRSRGPGRRIAAARGRPHGTHRPCPLTCVETWRSSGKAVGETPRTIARQLTGRGATHARSRAARGCQQVSMWRTGAGSRAPQAAAAVVAAAACEQGQESAPRALNAGRSPGNGSIVTHQRYAGCVQGGEFAGPGRNRHNRRRHNTHD